MSFLPVIILFLCIYQSASGQDCESKDTCGQCIQELECFWCTSVEKGEAHCLPKLSKYLCSPNDSEDPKSNVKIVDQADLSEAQQISPQKISLKLRKNEKFKVNFQYMQSASYPVDLYYIMDLSMSMLSSKNKLGALGKSLADEMKKKTKKFKIGFGSFVDKLTLPYVNTHPKTLNEPCDGCAKPYSFKNHLSLTQDSDLFSREVNKTRISGNLDTPEGGFDAMMQAIVCKNEIGWRPNARHLLVMSTDAVSHIAGDGKLGGVIEPNDAQCHMYNNSYTADLEYDYPSVSQLNYVARQNNINIIFAIVIKNLNSNKNDHLKNHYRALSDAIENSKMGTLDENSDNVVKFISQIYDQIRDSVRITSNTTKAVDVKISSTCSGFAEEECSSVKPGQIVNFTALIEPLVCDSKGIYNKKIIKIKPEGLEDSLIIELDIICDCNCTKNTKKLSTQCSEHGDLECGICKCDDGWFGSDCRCDRTQSKGDDPSLCIKPGGKNETCSGQGKCICGKCQCRERQDKNEEISGKYCECDNFSCPLKCSGNGICKCGTCICDNGYSGTACECSSDKTQCLAPGRNEICSGKGQCKCGQCVCGDSKDGGRYSGKYCEECTSCPAQRCDELRPCVESIVSKTGVYNNDTDHYSNCNSSATNIVDKLEEHKKEEEEENGIKRCRILIENDCTISFEYSYDKNKNLIITAEKHANCPKPPNVLAWILGVAGTVLLAGIIALIAWKIGTTIHDKNEYAKFESERNQTRWNTNQNPLYKPGATTFVNPSYKRASQRMSVKNEKPLDKNRSSNGIVDKKPE